MVSWSSSSSRSAISCSSRSTRRAKKRSACLRQPQGSPPQQHGRLRSPRHWSRSTRCWHQLEVVWIDPPPRENAIDSARLVMAAWSAAEASSFLAVSAAADQVPLGEICTAAAMEGGWGLTLAADGRGRTAIAAGSQLRAGHPECVKT